MSRSIAIALTFSAAAHLAAVGFGPAPAAPVSQTGAAVLTVRLAQPDASAPARVSAAPAPRVMARNEAATPPPARNPAAARTLPTAPPALVAAPVQMPAETPVTDASARRVERAESSSDALQQQIRQLLSGHFHYPRLARQRGWEGVVEVALHVAADGRISRVALHRRSGHATLDQAALSAAGRLRSVPEAAAQLNGAGLDLVVPVHYRLDGG